MSVDFKYMCDKCFRVLSQEEKMFGFYAYDDFGVKRGFRGHEDCVQQIIDTFTQIYGMKEEGQEDGKVD